MRPILPPFPKSQPTVSFEPGQPPAPRELPFSGRTLRNLARVASGRQPRFDALPGFRH